MAASWQRVVGATRSFYPVTVKMTTLRKGGTHMVITWANRAGLARIDGLTGECAGLLEAAGVDTVPELAQRDAANFYIGLVEVNGEQIIAHGPPSAEHIAAGSPKPGPSPRPSLLKKGH